MKKVSLSLLTASVAVSAMLTLPHAPMIQAKEETLNDQVQELSRGTSWEKLDQIDLQFDVFHPQGMTKVGDLYFMSSVEIIEGTTRYEQPIDGYDRSPGKGKGHLFVFNEQGELLEDIELGEGDMYHPGGIDYDGKFIWVPVAEYRPNSESIVYKVNAETLEVEEAFRADDHIGGIVKNDKSQKLHGVSWGSRLFYEWNHKGKQLNVEDNPSHFVDYQDCESTGNGQMICSGITNLPNPANNNSFQLGGLALLDLKNNDILHEVPVTELSPKGNVITRNPVFLEKAEEEIKLYAVPDDDDASLLIYQTTNLSK
ncbi:DUF6454 family protein [Niallia sp. Krafla_26]|uniref:DUF6454 family protein n=1 Tax=Niallia sp. Krafla_26 TaxID=3064703 RepID=UPI003D17E286